MAEAVHTTREGPVLVITLNRPEVKNAIDSALSLGVLAALAELDGDDDLRVGVLTGAGGTFCAGMDLKAFARDGLPERVDDIFRIGCRKPLVAAIEGVAVGGGLELALVADLLVASERRRGSARPRSRFGLFPGGGALLRLPRSLASVRRHRDGPDRRALCRRRGRSQHGLIVRMCEPGATLDAARELAARIARNAPLGVEAVKRMAAPRPGPVRRRALARSSASWWTPSSTPRTRRRVPAPSPRSARPDGPVDEQAE